MTIPPRRVAALAAVAGVPALILLAFLILPINPTSNGIARAPLEFGPPGRTHGWIDFSGFYPAEVDGGRPFNWMSSAGRIRLPRLDRRSPLTLSLWVQPAVTSRPIDLTIAVDGIALPPRRLTAASQQVDVALPASGSTRAVINATVSDSLVPGGSDVRSLGMRVDGIALAPVTGRLHIPAASLREAAIAGLAIGIVATLMLGARPLALVAGAGTAAWFGFLLAYDGAALGSYPDRVRLIGVASAVAAVLLTAATRDGGERWGFRAAVCIAILLTGCKLALFFHPMAPVGDSIFHVHRANVVQGGEYFFTSITPRPFYEFPYPPGLYVVAGPLWQTFRGEMEHMWLLRTIALAAEALLALALYGTVFLNWRNRLAAFLATGVMLLLPVGFYTICTSNLTNSFGQSVFGAGIAALLCTHLWPAKRWCLAAGTVLVCSGFLSHFSTFSVGIPLLFACAAAVFAGGAGAPRRVAISIVLALAIASTTSIALYYAHFMPVYKRTAERILHHEDAAQTRSMVAPPSMKAQRFAATIGAEFGAGVLIAAVAAGFLLFRSRARDPLTLALAGWAAVVVGFWLLGIVTAIEMRASLAAQPLAAIAAAYALARGPEHGVWYRIAAGAATASLLLLAVSGWLTCLGLESFWRI